MQFQNKLLCCSLNVNHSIDIQWIATYILGRKAEKLHPVPEKNANLRS